MKKFLHLPLTAALITSCAKNKDEIEEPEPNQPVAETATEEIQIEQLPALKPEKILVKKKESLFVDPPTHDNLLTEEEKKTILTVPDTNQPPLPDQPEETGITVSPPEPRQVKLP